jgi:hypothetical protein
VAVVDVLDGVVVVPGVAGVVAVPVALVLAPPPKFATAALERDRVTEGSRFKVGKNAACASATSARAAR